MLRKVEQALQAAIEKPFSRFFPQQLQPAELKAPLREALEGSVQRPGAEGGPRVAANRYAIELNATDAAQFVEAGAALEAELATDLAIHAAEAGLVVGPYLGVTIRAADDVAATELRIRAEFAARQPARLVAEAGLPEAGLAVSLQERNVIGRAPDCDVVVGEGAVSRHHCEVVWEAVQYVLRDLGSANGTFLNGEQVQAAPLRDGDLIEVGFVHLRFRDR